MDKNEFHLYKDIQGRTNGEIYIGVVGPVRTGKSTFIKRFMDVCVIPNIKDQSQKERAIDELPQSGQGKTIMTTEPKFVPQEAAVIALDDQSEIRVRMVDCVGFLVEGASGYMEGEEDRMVKTPWFEEDITFEDAARVGTQKVIHDHATIGILLTTDGTIGELDREEYIKAEKQTVGELKEAGKPFVIVINTIRPYSKETQQLKEQLEEEHGVCVLAINCEQMQQKDILDILEQVLYEFPITRIDYYIPKWVEMLPLDHEIKKILIEFAVSVLQGSSTMQDLQNTDFSKMQLSERAREVIDNASFLQMNLSDGTVTIKIETAEKCYFDNISELAGLPITGEYQMISLIQELTAVKKEYEKVRDAFAQVQEKGYGVVMPGLADITMEDPVLIQHGSKYGVKMNAISPSIHMIRANIETEIAPIVGSKEQAEDLITYIKEGEQDGEGVWNTNIFGKSIGELMEDGIRNKIMQMDDECQMKLQDTMQKVVNDSNGGMICIII